MLKRNNILEIVTPEYITAVVSTDGRIRRKNRNNLGLYIKTQMIMKIDNIGISRINNVNNEKNTIDISRKPKLLKSKLNI